MKNEVNNEIENMKLIDGSRRKALLGAVSGAAVVSAWHAPVIKTMVLPAHATTSVDVIEEQEDETDVDFMSSNAVATVTNSSLGSIILGTLIPSAHAVAIIDDDDDIQRFISAEDLIFEAEAISTGNTSYTLEIAARQNPVSTDRVVITNYIYGWSGTISGLNTPTTLAKTGCADDETVTLISVSGSELVLEMNFFTENLRLELDPGSITMPTFPFACISQ